MKFRFVALVLGLSGLAFGVVGTGYAYIGGKRVEAPEFLSVVSFDQIRCTATKVGPRHFLMAGHCLCPSGPSPLVQEGDSLEVHYGLDRRVMRTVKTRVRSVHVHPSYLAKIARAKDANRILGKPGVLDLALLLIEDATPRIPSEAIEWTPLRPGDGVIVGGYGALNAASGFSFVYTAAWKKISRLSPTFATVGDLDADGKSHSMGWDGDSGGPVHLWSPGTRPRVVGVNTFVTGVIWLDRMGRLEDPKYSGTTNFVRLDHPEARKWLENIL